MLAVLDKSEGNMALIELKATKKMVKIIRNTGKFKFKKKYSLTQYQKRGDELSYSLP